MKRATIILLGLAMSIQMHTYVIFAGRWFITTLRKGMRFMGIPSPGLHYAMTASMVVMASVVTGLQKALHRFLS